MLKSEKLKTSRENAKSIDKSIKRVFSFSLLSKCPIIYKQGKFNCLIQIPKTRFLPLFSDNYSITAHCLLRNVRSEACWILRGCVAYSTGILIALQEAMLHSLPFHNVFTRF